MPERKIRINHRDRDWDGVEVGIKDLKESINTYELDDGTVLTLRNVVVQVVRIDDLINEHGEPTYVVRSQNVVAATVPDALRKPVRE